MCALAQGSDTGLRVIRDVSYNSAPAEVEQPCSRHAPLDLKADVVQHTIAGHKDCPNFESNRGRTAERPGCEDSQRTKPH